MRRSTTGILLVLVLPPAALATDSSVPFTRANQVHAMGITGQGVTVAVIDTGIYYDQHGLLGSIAPGGISFEGGVPYFDGGTDRDGLRNGSQAATKRGPASPAWLRSISVSSSASAIPPRSAG